MSRFVSTVAKIVLGITVVLPALIVGCTGNLGATVATTAADTFVATLAAAVANAIAGLIVPPAV
jgi:hypothetical protein